MTAPDAKAENRAIKVRRARIFSVPRLR